VHNHKYHCAYPPVDKNATVTRVLPAVSMSTKGDPAVLEIPAAREDYTAKAVAQLAAAMGVDPRAAALRGQGEPSSPPCPGASEPSSFALVCNFLGVTSPPTPFFG
jgi:hypothetical protein